MKKAFLLSFFAFVFLSCSKNKEHHSRPSSGKINSISIVIDNALWDGVVGDSLRNKFAAPVEGLPKEEPIFDINQYPTDVMEGFVTKSRAIIVVKKGEENKYRVLKNRYATPQQLFQITGKNATAILELIEEHAADMIVRIKELELEAQQQLLKDSLLLSPWVQKHFQLDLKVPKGYKFSIKKPHFVWLKKEFFSGSSSILVTEFPLDRFYPGGDVIGWFVRQRDFMGADYIKGNEVGSHMYVDTTYPLYLSKTNLQAKGVFEIKGTWRLKNSFMFGPFTSYLIMDFQSNRMICLEGFCYVSSQERRDIMFELEAVLKSVKITARKEER